MPVPHLTARNAILTSARTSAHEPGVVAKKGNDETAAVRGYN